MRAIDFYRLGLEYKKQAETAALAIASFEEAAKLCKQGDKSTSIVACYWRISEIQRYINLDAAYYACEKALKYAELADRAEGNYRLGDITLDMKWPLSVTYFKRAKELYLDKSQKAWCDFKIGMAGSEFGEDKTAIKAFEAAIEGFTNDTDKAECYFQMGLIHFEKMRIRFYEFFKIKNNLLPAITAFSNAIQLVPSDNSRLPIYHYYRGWAYHDHGNFAEAIKDYTQSLNYLETASTPSPDFMKKIRLRLDAAEQKNAHEEAHQKKRSTLFQPKQYTKDKTKLIEEANAEQKRAGGEAHSKKRINLFQPNQYTEARTKLVEEAENEFKQESASPRHF